MSTERLASVAQHIESISAGEMGRELTCAADHLIPSQLVSLPADPAEVPDYITFSRRIVDLGVY